MIIGLSSLFLWVLVLDNEKLAQYALYIALIADATAAIPTIRFLNKNPEHDRPLMWVVYALGYGVSIFAIQNHTFSNYALPVYMTVGAVFIAYPLIRYRIRKGIEFKEWY